MDKLVGKLILKLSLKHPDLENTTSAAESLLKQEKYYKVKTKLEPRLSKPEYSYNEGCFLLYFSLGRTIFWKSRDRTKSPNDMIDRAIDLFTKSN